MCMVCVFNHGNIFARIPVEITFEEWGNVVYLPKGSKKQDVYNRIGTRFE